MPTNKLMTSALPAFAFPTLARGFASAVLRGDYPGGSAIRTAR